MSQHYSNPKRATDAHALPDVETFWSTGFAGSASLRPAGWYWQSCFPGCMPDGEPNGPFATEQEAVEDAQSDAWQDDDEQDDEPSGLQLEIVQCAACSIERVAPSAETLRAEGWRVTDSGLDSQSSVCPQCIEGES